MNAVISDCGRYRYALSREGWLGEGTVLFVMLNPSTADASIDDPTIRRCMDFTRRWGFGRLEVGNLYAYRATDPRQLRTATDPVGEDNDTWLSLMAMRADEIVAAWGTKAEPARAQRVIRLLEEVSGRIVSCLGQTADSSPKHPLYLRADTPRAHLQETA